MTDQAPSSTPSFSSRERAVLRIVARTMIPASRKYNVPGADDPAIFEDILASIKRDGAAVKEAVRIIEGLADGRLQDFDSTAQSRILLQFRQSHPELAGVLEAAIARCYYRDDRVMASIGMEVRPPFPLGYEVVEGDWSLLDPVRARGKAYRDAV